MLFFFPTFASVLRCGVVVVVNKEFLVVVVNDAAHVRHAAVAHFHVSVAKCRGSWVWVNVVGKNKIIVAKFTKKYQLFENTIFILTIIEFRLIV